MAHLDDNPHKQISEFLADLNRSATLQIFSGPNQEYSPAIIKYRSRTLSTYPFFTVEEISNQAILKPGHDTDQPAIGPIGLLLDEHHHAIGARYLGIPSGLALGAFLKGILAVSTHPATLSNTTKVALHALQKPIAYSSIHIVHLPLVSGNGARGSRHCSDQCPNDRRFDRLGRI